MKLDRFYQPGYGSAVQPAFQSLAAASAISWAANAAPMASESGAAHEVNEKSSKQDCLIDVVLLRGAEHLALINVGLDRAIRLCQARVVEFDINSVRKIPIHTDGEPWHQPGISSLRIELKQPRSQATFLKKCEHGVAEKAFVRTLTHGIEKGIITPSQKDALLDEMTHVVESEKEVIDSEAEHSSYFGLGQNTFLGNFADGLYKVASGHNLNLLGAKPQGRGRT